jgi:Domain of unknown function (DUF6379)
MLERSHIQSTGFRNTGPEGARTGFEVRLRLPNYRNVRLSLIERVDLVVDDTPVATETIRFRIAGRTYTAAAMQVETEVRWEVGTVMTLCVELPGGLASGVHEIRSVIHFRHPYFPPRFRPTPAPDRRFITLVFA